MTDDRRHAELGASKAARWMACPGSVRMARGAPDVDTVYAAEGRRAHSLAEARLRDDQPQLKVLYDAEMWEHVDVYVSHVLARRALITEQNQGRAPAALYVEETFDLGALGADEEMYGTADAVLLGANHLEVIDLKYGAGVLVEVNDNAQLLYYLVGALIAYGTRRLKHGREPVAWLNGRSLFEAALGTFTTFRSTIVQPRAGHRDGPIRSADYTADDVRKFVTILLQKAADTARPDAPLVPGSHCRFCPAHATCPAVKKYAMELAQADFSVVPVDAPPAPESLSLEVAADILRQAPILEDWLAALRARVERELMAGRDVRGWKLVDKRATRKWKDEAEFVRVGADLVYEQVVRSPAQVEKLIGKKQFALAYASLVEKKSSGTTLVPENDARPAAKVGAQHEFAALAPGDLEPSTAPIPERNTAT